MAERHPFWQKKPDTKYIYCFGLAVMALGHMKAITETKYYFDTVMEQIGLSQEQRSQLISDINNRFEQRLQEVFLTIKTKQQQYCFVLDLYKILSRTEWAEEYCSQVLEEYLQVFQFSAAERIFFQEFYRAMQEEEIESARQACQCFEQEGYRIRYDFLTYFYPGFSMQEQYEELRIAAGRTVLLDKPTIVRGDIYIEKGGSLLLYGAELTMKGMIRAEGGRIQLRHSKVFLEGCQAAYWLQLHSTAVVTIEDSILDCGGFCGAVEQNSGRLVLRNSVFRNTAYGRAVLFSGISAQIEGCCFQNGRDGGIALLGIAAADIICCEFSDMEAENGAGIMSEAMEDVFVQQCRFCRCRVRYLGPAVYFRHQRLGQQVIGCSFSDCLPEGESCFNHWGEGRDEG